MDEHEERILDLEMGQRDTDRDLRELMTVVEQLKARVDDLEAQLDRHKDEHDATDEAAWHESTEEMRRLG